MRRAPFLPLLALLALAGFALLRCGGGGGGSSPTAPSPPPPGGMTTVVEVQDDRFQPQSVTVQPGTTVRWVMRGTHPGHTVTEENGVFDSGFVFVSGGDAFEHTFTQSDAGRTFLYYCQSHQACCNMQGSVRVGAGAPQPPPGY